MLYRLILINLVSEEGYMITFIVGFISGIVFVLAVALLVSGEDD